MNESDICELVSSLISKDTRATTAVTAKRETRRHETTHGARTTPELSQTFHKFLFRTSLSWLPDAFLGSLAACLERPATSHPAHAASRQRHRVGGAVTARVPHRSETSPDGTPTSSKSDRRVAPPFDDHRPHARDDQVKSTRVARITTHQNARRTPLGAAATDAQRLTQPQYASKRLNPPLPNLVCDAHRLSTPTTPLHAPPTSTNAVLCSSTAPPPAAGSAGPVATTGSALARAHVRPPLRRDRP
jgi:hypothetical protein